MRSSTDDADDHESDIKREADASRSVHDVSSAGHEGKLSPDSPLFGGPMPTDVEDTSRSSSKGYEAHPDLYTMPSDKPPAPVRKDLDGLLPAPDPTRDIDDWGRSESFYSMVEPIFNFYYKNWFRVECEGIDNVPLSGGALLVANHAGAIPPDALMITQAIRNEHSSPRPVYMLGENWFKGYPVVGMLANKIGMVAAHPANAQRLLHDEGKLALVFPEGEKGARKLYWQRYRLRRFGRGGFVSTALKAQTPIVPIAVVGAEEAMPVIAHVPLLQKLTGLIYFPITPTFPMLGPIGSVTYLPAKFKIRFLDPIPLAEYGPDAARDVALVQQLSEDIRSKIHRALQSMLSKRRSVWFG